MDSRILHFFNKRDERALAETRESFGKYCLSIASRIVGDAETAEEVVNDALLKAWETIPPAAPGSLKSYMGMLTRQAAISRMRADGAQKRGSGAFRESLDELAEVLPDRAEDIAADRIALRDALTDFIERLPGKNGQIFLMRYWYAYTVREIAQYMGMREGSVRQSLARSREKLRETLEKEGLWS